ncbi:MAG: hypothetical protein ACRDD1_15530, partial [Planctomycetia bacterium]
MTERGRKPAAEARSRQLGPRGASSGFLPRLERLEARDVPATTLLPPTPYLGQDVSPDFLDFEPRSPLVPATPTTPEIPAEFHMDDPPQPTGAVGPDWLVATTNQNIGWRLKTGVLTNLTEIDLEDFFSLRSNVNDTTPPIDLPPFGDPIVPVGVDPAVVEPGDYEDPRVDFGPGLDAYIGKPRVIFDTFAQRFVVVAINTDEETFSRIYVAVSNTADPNQGWQFQMIAVDRAETGEFTAIDPNYTLDNGDVVDNGGSPVINPNPPPRSDGTTVVFPTPQPIRHWADFPSVGVTSDSIIISANMMTFDGTPQFTDARLWIGAKFQTAADALDGDPPYLYDDDIPATTTTPAVATQTPFLRVDPDGSAFITNTANPATQTQNPFDNAEDNIVGLH